MSHPNDGIATNQTIREIVTALGDLSGDATLEDILTKLSSVINESNEVKATITGDIEC